MAPDWLGRAVTLNDLWNMNKTLIITYSHNPSSAFSDMLWSEVRHVWGNQRTPMGLKGFLSGKTQTEFLKEFRTEKPEGFEIPQEFYCSMLLWQISTYLHPLFHFAYFTLYSFQLLWSESCKRSRRLQNHLII